MEYSLKNKEIHRFFKKSFAFFLACSVLFAFSFPNSVFAQQAQQAPTAPAVSSNSQAQQALTPAEIDAIVNASIVESAAAGTSSCIVSGLFSNALKAAVAAGEVVVDRKVREPFNVPVINTDVILQRAATVSAFTVGGFPIFGSWDAVGWCLANVVIEYIGQSTVDWINGGFQGNPVFVEDPERFFRDIADIEAGTFIEDLGGGFLCEPFRVNVQIGLLNSYRGGYRRNACTLSDIIENVEGFVEGNFEEGGWEGWFHMTQNPYNNVYGSRFHTERELRERIYASQNAINIDLTWSSGFLSFKDPETGQITTPGRVIDQQVNNRLFNGERRLLIADEFDEIINALVNQLVRIALSEVLENKD